MTTKTTLIVQPCRRPENIQVSLVRRQFTNASRVLAKFSECDSDLLLLEYDVEEEHMGIGGLGRVRTGWTRSPYKILGSIITKEGCRITFLYVLQHHVLPFQLLDKSELGQRKILALFLVDLHMNIVSLANVPASGGSGGHKSSTNNWTYHAFKTFDQDFLGNRESC